MQVHLVDGTYELFRSYFGAPPAQDADGREVGAVRGLMRSLFSLLRQPDVSHVAVAFDTEIESFRNDMFDGYKTGEGLEPELHEQFPIAERGVRALGVTVWSMIEFEADDALMSGAAKFTGAPGVERVVLCSPDKDLAQAVIDDTIVCFDRRKQELMDEAGVIAKFGVKPKSIPDYLALVGDTADGIPGIPRWGAKSTSTVLAHYESIENIPDDATNWQVSVRGAKTLAENLAAQRDDAKLYRQLATLRRDVPLAESLDELRWTGANMDSLRTFCDDLAWPRFADEVATRS